MQINEIRDYIERAPKKWSFDGMSIVNNNHSRFKWLSQLAFGTIHERINRRAGQPDVWQPWKTPVNKSIVRHRRKLVRQSR